MSKGLCFLVGVLASVQAHAISDVSIVAGANRSGFKSSGVTGPAITPQVSYNAGVLVGFGSGSVSVETGVLYIDKKYKLFTRLVTLRANVEADIAATYVELPLVLRLNMGFVSLGLGGYYAPRIGDSASGTIQIDGGQKLTISNATSNLTSSDLGALAFLRFHILNSDTSALFLDGRYQYGIADIDSSSIKANSRDIQVYLGYQFKLGK